MASKQEKTEKATPKKLENARKEGQISQSKDFTYFMNLATGAIFILIFGQYFANSMVKMIEGLLSMISAQQSFGDYIQTLFVLLKGVFFLTIAISLIFSFLNYALQTHFYFNFGMIAPKFSKINPVNYFTRLFGSQSLVDMIKSLIVIGVLSFNTYLKIKNSIQAIGGALMMSWEDALVIFWGMFKVLFLESLIILFIVGVLDYFYQRYQHAKQLRMTKQEVKDETKETEGNPLMKMKQKEMMLSLLKKDAINKIKEGTMTIVNPTHYAVCLRYNPEIDQVPVVILKGTDYLALFIKQLSYENKIPVVEHPPLARELHARVEEGWVIPTDLYEVVAKILIGVMSKIKK